MKKTNILHLIKKHFSLCMAGLLTSAMLTGCGQDPEITEFKNEMDSFCTKISEIDTSINNIDADAENAKSLLIDYLEALDREFQYFSQLDFPEEYDYLESLADESSTYMTEAVQNYKNAFAEEYNDDYADYAKDNYSRAYKRIQIIITFLHGEEPEDVKIITE